MERRIAAEYKKAAGELQGKIDAYFASFAKRDEAQKKLIGTVVNGREYTEQDYKQWRLAQISRGKRFEALRDRLAERMTGANEVAAAYMNDQTPGIYALNRNYAAYTIERQVGEDVGFDLWDEQTAKRLIAERPDLMPYYPPERAVKRGIDLAWGKRQITAQVTSGILQGESIKHLADRLQTNIPNMNRDSAIRAARTAVTGAQNAGRQESYSAAAKMGIELEKEWLATLDGRTRHSHGAADGQSVAEDKPFSVGGYKLMYPGDPSGPGHEIYNCFVGETRISSDSDIVRGYRHEYNGDLIVIKTSRGVEFTCTPNHPILTPNGWVGAALLHNGDDLIITFREKIDIARVNPDIDHVFPRIDALYQSFDKMFAKRACALSVNFHGDIPTSDVEIVTKKRFLRNNGDSSSGKRINKFLFKHSNKTLMGQSSLMEHFWSICKSTLCFVGCKSKPFPFFWRRLSHTHIHGFRTVPWRNVGMSQDAINNLSAKSETLSQFLNGFSGEIATDKIIGVKIIPSGQATTHVYNLQTKNGYYFVNSSIPQNRIKCNGIFAIAKNCRCTTIAKVKGVDMSDAKRRARDLETGESAAIENMTYAQWAEGKRQAGKVYLQNQADSDTIKNIGNEYQEIKITQKVIEKIPLLSPEGWNEKKAEKLREANRLLLKAVKDRELGTEAGQIFDLEMAPLTPLILGETASKSIRLPGASVPYVAIHNHPDGFTFSEKDVETFVFDYDMRIMEAVGHNGNVYLLQKTERYQAAKFIKAFAEQGHRLTQSQTPQEYADQMNQILKEAEQYGVRFITGG